MCGGQRSRRAFPHSSKPACSGKAFRPWCERSQSRSMVPLWQREPDRVFCEWHHSRQGRRSCRPHRALVEWPDRRADHEAKAGKTPDVRRGEDRPPASPAARRHLVTQTVIEVASEPLLDAYSQVVVAALFTHNYFTEIGCRRPRLEISTTRSSLRGDLRGTLLVAFQ